MCMSEINIYFFYRYRNILHVNKEKINSLSKYWKYCWEIYNLCV